MNFLKLFFVFFFASFERIDVDICNADLPPD